MTDRTPKSPGWRSKRISVSTNERFTPQLLGCRCTLALLYPSYENKVDTFDEERNPRRLTRCPSLHLEGMTEGRGWMEGVVPSDLVYFYTLDTTLLRRGDPKILTPTPRLSARGLPRPRHTTYDTCCVVSTSRLSTPTSTLFVPVVCLCLRKLKDTKR